MTLHVRMISFAFLLLIFPPLVFQTQAALALTTRGNAPLSSSQQSVQALIDKFSRHTKRKDCKTLNKLTRAYLQRADGAGDIARKYAITALLKPALPQKTAGCVYDDKKTAFHLAVEMFRASAQLSNWSGRQAKHALSTLLLEASLGQNWREDLARAGVAAAMQELVVLNMTCQQYKTGQTSLFWQWAMTDAGKKKHDPTFAGLLQILARSNDCKSLKEPARIRQACYWNERESQWSTRSHEIVVTGLMLGIRSDILLLAKAKGMLNRLSNLCKPKDNHCFNMNFQKKLRNLVSSGCKAILPASAYETMLRQLRKPLPHSLESLSLDQN